MRSGFILSCESTIDLPYSYCEQRDIPVLFYSYRDAAHVRGRDESSMRGRRHGGF